MSVELSTIAPLRWLVNISGAVPALSSADNVSVGDFVVDRDTTPDTVWRCLDNTPSATVYALDGVALTRIVYNSHGLTTGILSTPVPIARVGSSFALAKADTADNVETIGVAVQAVDANTLMVQQTGRLVRSGHGVTGPLFVSADTAGALVSTAPTAAGRFIKPIINVVDATTLEVLDRPAMQIAAPTTYTRTFTNSDLSSGVLTVNHSLGEKVVHVVVADGSDKVVAPTDVTYTSVNALSLDLSSFGAAPDYITGTWTVKATKAGGAESPAGGMWTLVERYVVSGSAAARKTFSGLNGNTAIRYKLVTRMIGNASGTVNIIVLANDDSEGNYPTAWTTGNAVADTISVGHYNLGGGWNITNTRGSGLCSMGVLEIDALAGFPRIGESHSVEMQSGTTINSIQTIVSAWTNIADNITSLTVTTTTTTGIGVGSYIELWKLAQ